MRFFLLFILLVPSIISFGQKKYILKPDAQKYLIVDNKNGFYKAGDTLILTGYFKAVAIYNLSGKLDSVITIMNDPTQILIIGDSIWSGGSWGHGLAMRNCHFIKVGGTHKNNFKIIGSNSAAKDANGYPVKTAYFDLMITEGSDNFSVHDISIRHGGVGVLAKTDTYGTRILNNFEFYNMDIYNTYNEAMYIGHTTSTPNSTGQFPYKLNNVLIYHNYVHDIGNDGIQIAASDNVLVNDNEVYNWGTKNEFSHSGGICMGSRMIGFEVRNNYVHEGFGNMLQVFSDGNGIVTNNLFVKNKLDGVIVRAASPFSLAFINNTIAFSGENIIRINGSNSRVLMVNNILAGPYGGSDSTALPKEFIYTENGGVVVDSDNIKRVSGADTSYAGYGYQSATTPSPPPVVKKKIASLMVSGYQIDVFEDGTTTTKVIP